MKEYKSLTELIPEMEPDEIFYKRIFLEYPEAHLDQAHTVEEIENSVRKHLPMQQPVLLIIREMLWMKPFFLLMKIRSFSATTDILLRFYILTLF